MSKRHTLLLLYIDTVLVGQDGRLDGPCLPGGRCLDDNTFCNNGICKCDTYHFDKNKRCGKSANIYLKLSSRI